MTQVKNGFFRILFVAANVTSTSTVIPGADPATTYVLRLKALKGATSRSGIEKNVTTN